MLQVSGLRVKNLRSLRDTGWIELRPINILVGKNSAGKSSFARVFPLLKQSAERRKQSPLLWYGRLVDFGSFSDAVSSFADQQEIQLGLRFTADSALHLSRRNIFESHNRRGLTESNLIDVTLALGESPEGRTQLKRLELNVFGVSISAEFSDDQTILLNGERYALPVEQRAYWVLGVILPQLRMMLVDSAVVRASDTEFSAPRRRPRLGESEVLGAISNLVHGNTLLEKKADIADRLPITNRSDFLQACRELRSAPDTWKAVVSSRGENDYWISRLHTYLLLYKLDLLLAELDDALSGFCDSISYLEPLRATAQRYYRREEVSVDEIDAKGLNTAFFIQGLMNREREALNAWLKQTFNFQLRVQADRGHAALHIISDDSPAAGRNMADVGLGYSQLAPVAIQLWAARLPRRQGAATRNASPYERRKASATVVVEQPELHLHPAYQAKLADVFASCIREDSSPAMMPRPTIIAETHSATLIGRLGELIIDGKLTPSDVNVLVFEPDGESKASTKVRISRFGEDGVLQNWPIGFFDY